MQNIEEQPFHFDITLLVAGITAKGAVGKKADFLDVTVELTSKGKFTTCLFIKPTDASQYLHRRSDHGPHTFKSIPFSQFRRAVVLCSETNERQRSIDYMSEKLRNSGYQNDEISVARENAMKLNHSAILSQSERVVPQCSANQLIFTINRNQFMATQIKKIIHEYQEDIDELVGNPTRLIVAERRNANTASLLFAKSSFSKESVE